MIAPGSGGCRGWFWIMVVGYRLFDHMCSCSVSNSAASALFHSIMKSDQIFICFIIFGLTLEVGVPGCDCGLGFEKKSRFLVEGL